MQGVYLEDGSIGAVRDISVCGIQRHWNGIEIFVSGSVYFAILASFAAFARDLLLPIGGNDGGVGGSLRGWLA